ncbi:uncharacterized protein LOC118484740 [Helianthus annuus]|uniref:uncharacterized protein LOC118484740 n=1 Tax=Helianthus annuus TaxID=4232 RepID=UPI001653277E|nr:uncharacterized protein LOC118484740 [Helianthus annuus]
MSASSMVGLADRSNNIWHDEGRRKEDLPNIGEIVKPVDLTFEAYEIGLTFLNSVVAKGVGTHAMKCTNLMERSIPSKLKKWKMMLRGGDYGLSDCCRDRVVVHHQILEGSSYASVKLVVFSRLMLNCATELDVCMVTS